MRVVEQLGSANVCSYFSNSFKKKKNNKKKTGSLLPLILESSKSCDILIPLWYFTSLKLCSATVDAGKGKFVVQNDRKHECVT